MKKSLVLGASPCFAGGAVIGLKISCHRNSNKTPIYANTAKNEKFIIEMKFK